MSMEQALAECYASEPVDEFSLDTIELIHPAFIDNAGNQDSIRAVLANEAWDLTLEADAPLKPGQTLTFSPIPFTFTMPGFSEGEVPKLTFGISNVSRIVTQYLEQAIEQTTPITLIYRPYSSKDTSAPQLDPVIIMELSEAVAGVFQVTGVASLSDVHNYPFPAQLYTPTRFPALVR